MLPLKVFSRNLIFYFRSKVKFFVFTFINHLHHVLKFLTLDILTNVPSKLKVKTENVAKHLWFLLILWSFK